MICVCCCVVVSPLKMKYYGFLNLLLSVMFPVVSGCQLLNTFELASSALLYIYIYILLFRR